jgi:HIV-1 Vpr-binding protein
MNYIVDADIRTSFACSPHKCPDPKPKKLLYGNFATRYSKGIHNRRLDEHLIHSRFCPVKTFRFNEEDGYYMCCEFVVSSHEISFQTKFKLLQSFGLM